MPTVPSVLVIESLDERARAVAHDNHTRYMCDGALPGERISVHHVKKNRRHFEITDYAILEQHPNRISAPCQYYKDCGGCHLQQLGYPAQLAQKNTVLKSVLARYPGLQARQWLPPLTADPFQYRRRARLGVYHKYSGELVIGFRRRNHTHILDLQSCDVLDPRLAILLPPLHKLVATLTVSNRLPQIELAAGDRDLAIIIRHLVPLTAQDEMLLNDFAVSQQVQVYTQSAGPDSARLLASHGSQNLSYSIPGHDITIQFLPTDFIQANARLNALMVNEVVHQLDLTKEQTVLELFCGLGNFTLPIARQAHNVIALEGHAGLVLRAQGNAASNNINNVQFQQADLQQTTAAMLNDRGKAQTLLLDPPREGAITALKQLDYSALARIVYVSCEPKTLARDLAYLVNRQHYQLQSIRLVDMFPQTRHIESIAVLSRDLHE